jgi:hypothetical protein
MREIITTTGNIIMNNRLILITCIKTNCNKKIRPPREATQKLLLKPLINIYKSML